MIWVFNLNSWRYLGFNRHFLKSISDLLTLNRFPNICIVLVVGQNKFKNWTDLLTYFLFPKCTLKAVGIDLNKNENLSKMPQGHLLEVFKSAERKSGNYKLLGCTLEGHHVDTWKICPLALNLVFWGFQTSGRWI